MSYEFDQRIHDLTTTLGELRETLARACEAVVDVTARWVSRRWDEDARAIVTGQPDIAKDVEAKGGLTRARGEINGLVANARSEVERILLAEHRERWPHLAEGDDWWRVSSSGMGTLGPRSDMRIYAGGRSAGRKLEAPTALEGAFGDLVDRPGTILRPYGFEVRAPWRAEIPEGVAEAVNRYADIHERAAEAGAGLRKTRREKAESEAGELWDR